MEIKEIIKSNKEIIKQIEVLDEFYCQNIKRIATLQSDNVIIKTECNKLRTGIRQVRVYRHPRLTTEEKAKIIKEAGKCLDCPSEDNLTVHHKKPLSQGGTNESNNLEVICLKCHKKHHPINETAVKYGEIKIKEKK